jgi:hypothetical protein
MRRRPRPTRGHRAKRKKNWVLCGISIMHIKRHEWLVTEKEGKTYKIKEKFLNRP